MSVSAIFVSGKAIDTASVKMFLSDSGVSDSGIANSVSHLVMALVSGTGIRSRGAFLGKFVSYSFDDISRIVNIHGVRHTVVAKSVMVEWGTLFSRDSLFCDVDTGGVHGNVSGLVGREMHFRTDRGYIVGPVLLKYNDDVFTYMALPAKSVIGHVLVRAMRRGNPQPGANFQAGPAFQSVGIRCNFVMQYPLAAAQYPSVSISYVPGVTVQLGLRDVWIALEAHQMQHNVLRGLIGQYSGGRHPWIPVPDVYLIPSVSVNFKRASTGEALMVYVDIFKIPLTESYYRHNTIRCVFSGDPLFSYFVGSRDYISMISLTYLDMSKMISSFQDINVLSSNNTYRNMRPFNLSVYLAHYVCYFDISKALGLDISSGLQLGTFRLVAGFMNRHIGSFPRGMLMLCRLSMSINWTNRIKFKLFWSPYRSKSVVTPNTYKGNTVNLVAQGKWGPFMGMLCLYPPLPLSFSFRHCR